MHSDFTSIHWIAFDAVGTLIFPDPPVHLAYFRVGQKYGSTLSPAEVRTRFQAAYAERVQGLWSSAAADETGEREFWRSVVADVLPDVDDPEACFEELFAHFAEPASWQCFADVEETLGELAARGYRLAIASNFDARLHRICDGLPELSNITARIISSEVGAGKPQPAFFEAVVSTCECQPGELLMIGDDYENDVAAPVKLGIAAWHVDRGPDGADDCLRALGEVLDRLPTAPPAG
jgi:putative hydrolase of the HAD superfamily